MYLFLLMAEELSGEELVLALLAVSDVVGVLVKILLPGIVKGLFTAANTGAGLGCIKKGGGDVRYTYQAGKNVTAEIM